MLIQDEAQINYRDVLQAVKFLQGKVLTIMEASLPEGSQLKSVKSLINQEFSNLLDSLLSCLLNPKTSVPVGLTSEGNNFEELVESSGLLKKVK